MPFPTGMNNQESESISSVNTEVVGISPSLAMANAYIQTSQAMGLAALNAVQSQQENWVISRAALAREINSTLSLSSLELDATTGERGLK
jgi:hypothetical protein